MPSREHQEQYEALAQQLGVDNLLALVPFPPSRIKAALDQGDDFLNTLPLRTWDRQHTAVLQLVRSRPERKVWSLSSTVCVLKHVARHHLQRLLKGGNRNW